LSRLALFTVALLAPTFPSHSHARACRTIVVTEAKVGYAHAATIRGSLNEARPCDWILIAPGVYRESVVVRTGDLHIRGLDRNRVVLDGGHRPGNGIEVAHGEVLDPNVIGAHVDRRSLNDDATGNEIRRSRRLLLRLAGIAATA
jgi:hypothetical protein